MNRRSLGLVPEAVGGEEPTVLEIGGDVTAPFEVALASLDELPQREVHADFHCVAGWTATDLRWEGVTFETFYREIVEPALAPGASITHAVFRGLDGYRAVLM